MNDVQILATGSEFLKTGVRGIESVIEELIRRAEREIHIVAYLFTSQATHILNLLEKKAEEGVKIVLVINRLETQDETIRSKLRHIQASFPFIKIVDFHDSEGRQLHAKLIISDRSRAVLGSANFSWGGMVTNYEIGVLLEGEPAWKLAELVDLFVAKTFKKEI